MNHRVLELLKAPKNIQSEDLNLLKEEINSFPYVQNIRALYLYGVHLHDQENYQKVLSTTAAYTTDKKILYQLINGKIQQKPKQEIQSETVKEKVIPTENPLKILYQTRATGFPIKREEAPMENDKPEIIEEPKAEITEQKEKTFIPPVPQPEIKHIFVNGERNRILFEGEENFLLDENVEKIDLESTLESGSIVIQKIERKEDASAKDSQPVSTEIEDQETVEEIQEFTPETIIEEEKITSEPEKEEVLNESDVSFHETESFLPNVQIQTNEAEKVEETKDVVNENEPEKSDLNKTEETAAFTPEKIINEDKISTEKEKKSVRDDEELSFHGMQSFLPEIKIQANSDEKITAVSKPNINKHEEEMRRLIEEVERKMKEKAASQEIKKEEEPENMGHDISFAETQSFEVKPVEPKVEEIKQKSLATETQPGIVEEQKKEVVEEKEQPKTEEQPEVRSAWKPMSFESNLPDSLLNKATEIPQPKIQAETPKQEEILPKIEEIPALVKDKSEEFGKPTEELQIDKEAPVMNVSFFGSGWTIAQSEKQAQKEAEDNNQQANEKIEEPKSDDSNIPGFINTWQSWLKIDRTEPKPEEKTEIKNKVIETFIETNPKISQLKDEVNFVVKEKNDDISHLMTETLANLYVEQKLYTKAIKAFETLIKKTPEKKEYYEGRIQEIKDFRSKG